MASEKLNPDEVDDEALMRIIETLRPFDVDDRERILETVAIFFGFGLHNPKRR